MTVQGTIWEPFEKERVEAKEAAWSIVHGSDPYFVPKVLHINDEELLVELGPRMRRVYNRYINPDEALEICEDYGQLMDVEYIGEEQTLVVRLRCDPSPLPFPVKVTLCELEEGWENKCGVYGRIDFEGGHSLPIRGYRAIDTSPEDKSLICLKRMQRDGAIQVISGEVAPTVQMDTSPAVPEVVVSQQTEATPAGGAVRYPLPVGRMIVANEDWKKVSFGGFDDYPLGGQAQMILKAMYRLEAFSKETARSCDEIMNRAGITTGITVAKPFSSGGKSNIHLKELYKHCVSNAEERRGYAGRDYLTPPG